MTYPPNIIHASTQAAIALTEDFEAMPEYFVKVENTVYGPFTSELMEQFVEESRVGSDTLISGQPYGGYRPAAETAEFQDWEKSIRAKRYSGKPLPTVYLVIADIQPFKKREFLIIMQQMGQFQEISQTAWVLATATDIRFVREALSRNLTEEDSLFIHDSFSNSAGWFNLGEGVGDHVTSLWKETSKIRKEIKSA